MKERSQRRSGGSLQGLALLLLAVCSASNGGALLTAVQRFDIPAQSTGDALNAFSRQSGLRLLFSYDAIEGRRTNAIRGDYSAEEVLGKLLADTGLQYKVSADSVVLIGAAAVIGGVMKGAAVESVLLAQSDTSSPSKGKGEDRKESSGSSAASEAEKGNISEIIVTAQKREERLLDVPVPVTAISADKLVNSNQLQLQDYYTRIPALSLTTANPYGGAMIAIRGITTGGYTAPAVGVVVDDVPYTSSTISAGGFVAGDIDPSALARIELLRGPQGTLYGASSIGGLLKYVTVDPSMEAVSGRIQGGMSSVRNGEQLGYAVRGALNLPLSDTWAARASAYTRRDPGYIDDPVHGDKGINWGESTGGRLSTLWRPAQDISLKLGALIQNDKSHGASYVEVPPGIKELQQTSNPPDSTGYDKKVQIYSANLNAKLGRFELTSVSAYADKDSAFSFALAPTLTTTSTYTTGKFTQELRLSTTLGSKVDWLFGAFYNHENSRISQDVWTADFMTGARTLKLISLYNPTTFNEYAAFTDLTFRMTERFDVQIGGRQSQIRQDRISHRGPDLTFPTDTITVGETRSKETPFTYLFTPRFRVSQDLMMYARLASGYRPGGPNTAVAIALGLPSGYEPDKTQNYEIGFKGKLSNALSFDASVYYIDWKNIQLTLQDRATGFGYFANGAQAKSQGAELSVESRPLTGLTITAWVAWNDAQLTENFPVTTNVRGFDGDRLPQSSRLSGNLSVDQEFFMTSVMTGFVGGSVSYVGDRLDSFAGPSMSSPLPAVARQVLPAYTKVDLRAGVNYDSWALNLFINNLTDKRALLSGGPGRTPAYGFDIIQPRTVGLSLAKDF